MNQWLNFSHPQTLQAGVFLGYLSAVFGVLSPQGANPIPGSLLLLVFLAMGAGAFVTANNRRWGYQLLGLTAAVVAASDVVGIAQAMFDGRPIAYLLSLINNAVFPIALAAAVLHAHSREYQKVWFE